MCETLTCDLHTPQGSDSEAHNLPHTFRSFLPIAPGQVQSMICSVLLQDLLVPAILMCILTQGDISQIMFHSLPCIKMLVHESHSRDPPEFKYYRALAGDSLHLILGQEMMEPGTHSISNINRESPSVSSLFTGLFQNTNVRL